MRTPPRWFTDHGPEHSQWYIDRFRAMAAEGADLGGEARMLDAMVAPCSRVLDAGCGPGGWAQNLPPAVTSWSGSTSTRCSLQQRRPTIQVRAGSSQT